MEDELRKERIAILHGVKVSAKQTLLAKAQKNLLVAISQNQQVKLIPAKKLLR